jgi:hypothetical protein
MLKSLLIGLIWLYQAALSPLLPPACRFYPSCSHYAAEAIERRGVAVGLWLAALRLLRCHPWHPGGYDPVPEAGPARQAGPVLQASPVPRAGPVLQASPVLPAERLVPRPLVKSTT